MGVILDSSVLIAAERQGQNARQMLSAVVRKTGNTEVALSVITLLELRPWSGPRRYARKKIEA